MDTKVCTMDLPPGGPPVSLDGLPFLVTHWLANFGSGNGGSSEDNEERRQAIERIRNAGAEIASAFSTLGAFGVTRPVRRATNMSSISGDIIE